MRTLAQLRESRAEVEAKMQAIVAVAKEENRELTPEEADEIDSINADGGQLAELDKLIARAEKIEARSMQIARDRFNAGNFQGGFHVSGGAPNKINVPYKDKARAPLKAFKGETAEADAYVAGHWALATLRGNEDSQKWLADHGMDIRAAMSTKENQKGGYLVPEVLEATIITLVEQWGVFRSNIGNIWSLKNGNRSVPKHGSDFTWYWVGESEAGTASDVTQELVKLEAKKGMVLGRVSSELFEDSIVSVGDYIAQSIARAKAYAEDQAGFNGDGGTSYGHIVGLKNALAAGAVATAEANDNTLAELTAAPIHEAMGKLASYPDIMPKWYMHKSVWENAFKRLAFAAGGVTATEYAAGMQPVFMGYPVQFVNVLPSGGPATDLASTKVAYFGDLAMTAAMGEARGLTFAADSSVYFTSDDIAIRGTCRLDINVHERGDSSTAGSMVAIAMNTA